MSKPSSQLRIAVVIALSLGGLLAWSGSARAESVGKLLKRAQKYPDRVERLKTQYLKPAILESRYTLETRFNDARVAYLLEDYDRASLLLADVVRSEGFDEFESARRALYLLGESLYEERNRLSAKKYLERLVDRGKGPYYQDALVRLLQIAAETGNYEGVSKLYKKFDDEREMGPSVQYMRGKTLYSQGEPDRAIRFFKEAEKSDEWKWRARYFRGVCLADQQKFARAKEIFEKLTNQIDADEGQANEVRQLSYLALGRISYEQRNLEQAVNYYQKLPRGSEHFARALYELTWVLVSRESYEAAIRNADIFLYLADPDPTFIPEVKLLKADLLLRRDRYEEADAAYHEVIDQFKPLRKRMRNFLKKKRDLGVFFRRIVQQEFQGNNPIYMPKTVEKWIDRGETLQRARRMVQDVAELKGSIEQSREAIKQMRARLQSGSTLDSFPALAEGMTVGIETDSQLLALQRELLEKEYRLVKSEMTSAEKEEWRKMRSELEDFQEKYEEVPKTQQAIQERERQVEKEFRKLKDRLDSVSYMLEGQREQLESIDEYIEDNFEDGVSSMPPKKRRKVKSLRKEVRESIAKLEKREEKLRKQVDIVRQKVGVGDKVTRRERKMRATFRRKIAERRKFLRQFRSRVSGSSRDKLRKISQARSHVRPASKELTTFFNKMRGLVQDKAEDLREKLDREKTLLAERAERVRKMKKRSKTEAAKAALKNYLRVREKFDEIVMRGDVGLLDVVWQQKQEMTDRVEQVRQNRRRELKDLRQSFQEVR